MIIQQVEKSQKTQFNDFVTHPLQSWEWGEFRQKAGIKVIRLGAWGKNQLIWAYQLTIHQIPFFKYTIGYLPKGTTPTKEMIKSLEEVGRQNNCIFIKLEPNIVQSSQSEVQNSLIPSYKPLFTKYTFLIDLTKSEEELLKNMHPKTRYNIKVAQKHSVRVQEENTAEAFEAYLSLTHETTKRQGFYAHDDKYHRLMWQTLHPSAPIGSDPANNSKIAHLLTARYKGEILVAWILFLFKDVLYYPYGASSDNYKDVMASNLMMWETICWGKKKGARIFDLWGTPGANPSSTDPYYGFHRFKMGYAPKLVEFVGSFDLVLKPIHYALFKYSDKLRWQLLKFKAKI